MPTFLDLDDSIARYKKQITDLEGKRDDPPGRDMQEKDANKDMINAALGNIRPTLVTLEHRRKLIATSTVVISLPSPEEADKFTVSLTALSRDIAREQTIAGILNAATEAMNAVQGILSRKV